MKIANSVLNKGKSNTPPLFNELYFSELLSSASNKTKLLKCFLRTLLAFPCRTNMKLHNFRVAPRLIKNVISNLDLSKTSDSECIPMMVLKKYRPTLSYVLAELFVDM